MKLSLWNFVPYFDDLHIKCEIQQEDAEIEGIQVLDNLKDHSLNNHYVYLCCDTDNLKNLELIHGSSRIYVQGTDSAELLNRILQIFSGFNIWENELRALETGGSLQSILDKGTEVLQNPIVLSDLDGNVLSMSTEFLSDSSSISWVECRQTRRVPTDVLISPVYSDTGKPVSWSNKPEIFFTDQGQKMIGSLIASENGPIGALALWERKRKINPGDLVLIQRLNQAFLAFQGNAGAEEIKPFHSTVTILEDMMDGLEIEDDVLDRVQMDYAKPWVLELYESPNSPNQAWQKSLIRSIRDTGISCIPMIHNGQVLWMTAQKDADRLRNATISKMELRYFCIVRSMPFESLKILSTRYQQMQFVLSCVNKESGIYDCKSYGLAYMMHKISAEDIPHALIHPALRQLYLYDKVRGTDLYRSLYYYLFFEQSIQKGAEAVHVHRNSYLYRIQRIRDLTGINTDDPKERVYLLFSYFLEDAAHLTESDTDNKKDSVRDP